MVMAHSQWREAVAAARIRQELRERLMAERSSRMGGVWEILAAFGRLADVHPELRPEVERWRVRFELLADLDEPISY